MNEANASSIYALRALPVGMPPLLSPEQRDRIRHLLQKYTHEPSEHAIEVAIDRVQEAVCSSRDSERCFIVARCLPGDPEPFFRELVAEVSPTHGASSFRKVSPERYWWSGGGEPATLYDISKMPGGPVWYIRSFVPRTTADVRRESHRCARGPDEIFPQNADMRALLETFHQRLSVLESRCGSPGN